MVQIENKRCTINNLKNRLYLRSVLAITLFFSAVLLPQISLAQNTGILELLPGSDLLGYNAKTGAHRLVGNVSFNYQGNTMYCDSAHYYDKSQEVRAYGRVQINKRDTLNLYCDSLYYNGKTKQAKLWGHVRVRDNAYKLTTDSLDYDAAKGQAVYRNKGKVESITSAEVLTSKIGYFYPNSKNFFFKGDVVYKSPEIYMTTDTLQYSYFQHKVNFFGETDILASGAKLKCKSGWYDTQTEEGKLINDAQIFKDSKQIFGDTLYYRPKDSLSIGIGHVVIIDTSSHLELRGNYAYNSDKEKLNYITDEALAIKKMDKDTLYLHADTLFQRPDSNGIEQLEAYNNVQYFTNKIQGRCDTIIFSDTLDLVLMSGNPIIWAKNSELSGENMRVYMNDSSIQKVWIENNAMAVSEVDSGKYYNQIAGNEMFAFFKEDELSSTEVNGNAITLYYPEETQKTDSTTNISRKGMNKLIASNIRVYLDSGEVIGITYLDQPDGIFYPIDKIAKKDQFLENFQWRYYLKPNSPEEVMVEKEEIVIIEEKTKEF